MIPWMVYAAITAVLIAAGALAVERLVASQRKPRRFVWLAALTLAVVVPLLGDRGQPPPTASVPTGETAEAVAPAMVAVERTQGFVLPLPIPPSRTAARTAGIAWGAGSAAALAALSTVLVAVACARRRWPRRRLDGTDVYLSRRFGPALVGILAPKPVIPAWVQRAGPSARAAILRHELEHAQARDHLALLYAAIVAAAFPWSPAIWWMCRRLRAAIEIDCDRRVIASGIGAADYGALLLQTGSRSHGRWGLAPAMSQPASILERRLRTMNEKRKKLNAAHGALLASAALLAVGIACDLPAPTQLDEAIDEVMAGDQASDIGEIGSGAVDPPPLVLVDGVHLILAEPGTELRPMDLTRVVEALEILGRQIRSVQVIKGPELTATYGEEAANGVINFTTRWEAHGSGATLTMDGVTNTPEGLTAKDASLTSSGFTVTSVSFTPSGFTAKRPPLAARLGESIFTTNPRESLRYELAGRGNWLAKSTRGELPDAIGQQNNPVVALVYDLLKSPEVLRGTILFSDGEILSRIAVIRDDEG